MTIDRTLDLCRCDFGTIYVVIDSVIGYWFEWLDSMGQKNFSIWFQGLVQARIYMVHVEFYIIDSIVCSDKTMQWHRLWIFPSWRLWRRSTRSKTAFWGRVVCKHLPRRQYRDQTDLRLQNDQQTVADQPDQQVPVQELSEGLLHQGAQERNEYLEEAQTQ